MTSGATTLVQQFQTEFQPHEQSLVVLTDNRTGAQYCECHVTGSKLVALGTIDAALDPAQPGYKANRELLIDAPGFDQMKTDALQRRTFSNIVAEYVPGTDRPLQVIGGQHRFEAIRHAVENGIDELHGVKVYFGLTMPQRLDVGTISNTNLNISGALVDRLRETSRGSELRDWCQKVGLLKAGQDFSDNTGRGKLPVHLARTFIANFYFGCTVDTKDFDKVDTTPILYRAGKDDDAWLAVLAAHADVWGDKKLFVAGQQFARLVSAQRKSFDGKSGVSDSIEKGLNGAVLSAWAFAAGMYQKNKKRLDRHYALADVSSTDPLNAAALAKGKHPTDKDGYRGLGYRTDARERAQMVELFNIVADSGAKINAANVKAAISYYFGKKNFLAGQAALKKG